MRPVGNLFSSDTVKILLGVVIVAGLGVGDFFIAHRLSAGDDVALVIGAAYALGVHVAYVTPVPAVR